MIFNPTYHSKSAAAEEEFLDRGFVNYGHIDGADVQKLIALSDELNIPDYLGCDYNCGMNSDIYSLRKKMQESIIDILRPYYSKMLQDHEAYSATFVNKNPNDNCFVHAHQDFTYTDETEEPSIMCWIPLVDVDIDNGALGFIPKSHAFFDHIRAFPFPFAKTAIMDNEVKLMSYFEIVPMKAGEMLFFMNNTIHGSFANYTDKCRYSLSINFYNKKKPILAFVHNPKTAGNTMFKYEVENDFIVKYNNPMLLEMFAKGKLDIAIEPVEEITYSTAAKSWEDIKNHLDKHNIKPNKEYQQLIKKYRSHQLKQKIKDKIWNSMPFFKNN